METAFGVVKGMPLGGVERIDAALEGKWNLTVTAVWSRRKGFLGFSKVIKNHNSFRPSLELYFNGYWIGIHCYRRIGGKNVFDEKLALKIISYVDRKTRKS